MLILQNVRAVDPGANLDKVCDIVIEGRRIVKIAEAKTQNDSNAEVMDCTGLTAFPGLIDMHCHLREPGLEYKEDIESGTKSAKAGGFTGVACMPNTKPVVDNSAIVRAITSRAKEVGGVKVYPIGAISKGLQGQELAEMGDMQEAGIVAVSDDGRPVSSSSLMKKAMMYAAQFNLPVISHCEDLDLVDDGYMNEGYTATVLGLRGNPWASETNMVSRELILAEYLNVPVHIAHVSAKLSVELIREAKARGVQVTCETCPHYFTLTEEAVGNYDTNAKVNPPLRTKEDLEAIIAGLQDGTIDCIATDHAPHHVDEKRVEFAQAANGLVGFETAFGLSYTYLVETGKLTLAQLVEKMSLNPGLILGVGTRLEEGECADITVVDLNKEYTVRVADFLSKSKNSPYDGWNLKGSVVHTIVDGRI